MTPAAKSPYAGYRFPGEVISHAVWLYFRFPLSLRMVEEMLAARGIADAGSGQRFDLLLHADEAVVETAPFEAARRLPNLTRAGAAPSKRHVTAAARAAGISCIGW